MKRLLRTAWPAFSMLLAGAAGCAPIHPWPPAPTPAVTPALNTIPLSDSNAAAMTERVRAQPCHTDPVVGLAFDAEVRHLLVVCKAGALHRVRVADGALLSSLILEPDGIESAVFDHSATRLAVMRLYPASSNAREPLSHEPASSIQIWDAQRGRPGRKLDFHWPPIADMAWSPDGRWLFAVHGAGMEVIAQVSEEIRRSTWGDEESAISRMTAIDIDPSGLYSVVANQNGSVAVDQWTDGELARTRGFRLDPPSVRFEGDRPLFNPIDIRFSPTRKWVALLRDDTLIVWNLQSMLRQIDTVIGATRHGVLAFHPSGRLLAVGTDRGWQIWDIEAKKALIGSDLSATYALSFSADGRLFAWGDSGGVLHIWGVRNH